MTFIQISPFHISTKRIRNGNKQTVYYPQVVLIGNKAWEYKINQMIRDQVRGMIAVQSGDMPSLVEEMFGFYEIKNNQRNILSLTLSNYCYHLGAAHGMTYIKSLTFDFVNKKLCTLQDLFIPGSNYVEKISELIRVQIKQRNIPILNEFTSINPNQFFYIADKTLVIYFQLYEITPYVVGLPMFPISVFDLQDIIDENSPLARMAVNS